MVVAATQGAGKGGAGGAGKGGAGGAGGGSIFDQSARALQGAGSAFQTAANMYQTPGLTGGASTYNPASMSASTYNPAMMNAAQTANPAAIRSGIDANMNPFINNVLNNSMSDINRLTNMQQDQNAAGAQNAGAFGGSRHGLVEAQTNAEAQRNMGNLSAQLRSDAYNNAASMSAQDIANLMNTGQFNAGLTQQGRMTNQAAQNAAGQFNAGAQNTAGQFNAAAQNAAGQFNAGSTDAFRIAQAQDALARAGGLGSIGGMAANLGKTGFDIGQQTASAQAGQGALQQALTQNVMNLGADQFQQWTQQPQNMISTVLQAMGMSPLQQNTKTTQQYQPGMLDWASLATQALGAWMGGGKTP